MPVTAGLAFGAALAWLLASCASTDEGDGAPRDEGPSEVPDATVLDVADAGADAECSPTDPMCAPPVTCEKAEWCPEPANVSGLYALTAIWGSSKDDVWVSGSGGTLIHWDGSAWTPTPLPTESGLPLKNTFHALWGSGPNDVWVASTTNLIFHTDGFANGTATWTQQPDVTSTPVPLYAAWGSSADDLRFGGRPFYYSAPDVGLIVANQLVSRRAKGSLEWAPASGSALVHGIWGSSADDVWLIADNRASVAWQSALTLHGTRQKGELVWTEVDTRASAVLRGIWGSSANDVWIVGDQGTIRRLGANGTDWDVLDSPTTETLHAVWGSSANDVWVVGESGTIFHWDGAAWTPSVAALANAHTKPNLYGIWGSGPDDVWIVGEGLVLRYTGKTGGSK